MENPLEKAGGKSLILTGGGGLLVFFLVGQAFAVSIATDIVTSLMIFGTGVLVGKYGWK